MLRSRNQRQCQSQNHCNRSSNHAIATIVLIPIPAKQPTFAAVSPVALINIFVLPCDLIIIVIIFFASNFPRRFFFVVFLVLSRFLFCSYKVAGLPLEESRRYCTILLISLRMMYIRELLCAYFFIGICRIFGSAEEQEY